ncbi:MAG: flagellar hook-length control protein FliK [Magnetococcus sp. THC-1_WYH]
MLISGNFVQSVAKGEAKPSSGGIQLTEGAIISGRIGQVNSRGEGVLRLTDGSRFSFSGGQALKEGEQVRMEVVRLQPQITFRMIASESGIAQQMAGDMEQSLMRLPDIFSRLMNFSGLDGGMAAASGKGEGLFSLFSAMQQAGKSPLFVTSKGESMAAVLRRVLPNLSLESLQKGDLTELTRLLRSGGGEIKEMLQQLREAANDLRPAPGTGGGDQDIGAARQTLMRVGDLLAMQDVLPRTATGPDGNPFLGYRLFWLDERGLGEMIWRQQSGGGSGRRGDEEKEVTSVLITLNLTQLGTLQTHLSYAHNALQVAMGAEEDEALSALRGDIRQLRQALIAAELPLRSLELSKISRGDVQEKRLEILALGEGFSIEV